MRAALVYPRSSCCSACCAQPRLRGSWRSVSTPRDAARPGQLYAWAGLVGAFAVSALAIAPFTRHTWEWDATGLRWRGAWRSTALRWHDIERLGKSWDGRLFAADAADRRIYWPEYTLAHEELLRAILKARPDLTPPE